MVIDFSNFYDLPRQMDRIMAEFMRPYGPVSRGMAYPPLNISEDEENLFVQAEIPGVDMSEIELTLTNKSLVIKGERVITSYSIHYTKLYDLQDGLERAGLARQLEAHLDAAVAHAGDLDEDAEDVRLGDDAHHLVVVVDDRQAVTRGCSLR